MRPVEAAPHNSLHDQVIGGRGYSHTYPEVDLPIRRNIQIDRRKKLLLLIVEGVEITQTPIVGIVFESARYVFVEVITELRAGSKTNPLRNVLPMKRSFESGVDGEI